MKKIILLLVILTIGGGVAYYFYNKYQDTDGGRDGFKTNAAKLTEAFVADEKRATAKYLNEVLVVSGKPAEIARNSDGQTVVFLSEDGIYGVQCSLRDASTYIVPGKTVTLRGLFNGYTNVVLLSDCVIVP